MQNQISSWGHIRQTKTKGFLQSDGPVLFQKIDVIKEKRVGIFGDQRSLKWHDKQMQSVILD